MSDWPRRRLREIATIHSGGTPSTEEPTYWDGDIPWVTPGELTDQEHRYVSITERNITRRGLMSSGATLLPAGALLITTRATLGARTVAEVPITTNQGFKNLVFDRKIADAGFYYHLFSTLDSELKRRASGTTFLEVSGTEFGAIEVPVPPLKDQQRIAEILDSVDHGIASTEAVIAKLKLKSSGLLRALLHGVDAQARPLIDFLTARPRNGFSPNETESWTGAVTIGLGCLTTDGFVPRQVKNVPAHDARYAGSWLSDGDLLMSRSNTFDLVGLVGRYSDVGAPCVYPDLMMKLVPNKLVRSVFLELVLRNADAREHIKRMSQGTSGSMVKISAGGIVKLLVSIPNLQEQDRLLSIFAAETANIRALEREKAKLRLLKQGAMDDLLTGRVRVPVESVSGA